MSVPLLFMAAPVAAAALCALLYRWSWLQSALACLTVLLLALLALQIPLDELAVVGGSDVRLSATFNIFGRAFVFATEDRPVLIFYFMAALPFFMCGLDGRLTGSFVPAALLLLPLLAATIFVQPLLFAALFLELSAALAVLLLADGAHRATRGALRLLVTVTLGVPFILLAGWQLELAGSGPESTQFLVQAGWALCAGFAILLAAVPFHGWMPAVGQEAPAVAAAFLWALFPAAVLLFLLDALAQFDWLRSTALLFAMLRVAGTGLIVVCGALAFAQRNWGRLAGYAVLVEWGAILLAVGMRTPLALAAAAALLVMRVPALAVWAAGAGALAGGGAADVDSLRGRAHAQPFATLAALAGGLSLAGLPLTAGFAVRWTVLRMLAVQEFWLAAALVFAGLGVLVAHVRLLRALFEPAPHPLPETEPESAVLAGLALLGAGAVLALGINPQWLVPAATRMVEALAGKLG